MNDRAKHCSYMCVCVHKVCVCGPGGHCELGGVKVRSPGGLTPLH